MDVVLRFSKHIGNDLEELNTPISRLFEIIHISNRYFVGDSQIDSQNMK